MKSYEDTLIEFLRRRPQQAAFVQHPTPPAPVTNAPVPSYEELLDRFYKLVLAHGRASH